MRELNIRFNLSGKKHQIRRFFNDGKRHIGTQQLIAFIRWGDKEVRQLVKNSKRNKEFRNEELFELKMFPIRGMHQNADRATSANFHVPGMKVNKKGEHVKYTFVKIPTGLYILPASFDTKSQIAHFPYEAINAQLERFIHLFTQTYHKLKVMTDFSADMFVDEVKMRIKEGMPIEVIIPGDKAKNILTAMSAAAEQITGVSLDMRNPYNPKNVPNDLRDFIDFYHANRPSTKPLEESTIESHRQLKRKLQRWHDETGNIFQLTTSDLTDLSEFLKWRAYDNEENNPRSQKKKVKEEELPIGIGTMNKTKKQLKYFFNGARKDFNVRLQLEVDCSPLREEGYDRDEEDVFLSMEQLIEIINLEIPEGTELFLHRDLFILGCLSGGYRISDLVKLPRPELIITEDNERYYLFHVRSTKTNVSSRTPVPPEMNFIVERFPFGTKIKEHQFRLDIKTLGRMCGWTHMHTIEKPLVFKKYKKVTKQFFQFLETKTCRKTYCSLLYNYYKLSIVEAKLFSGHKTEEQFKNYLKIDKIQSAHKLLAQFKLKPVIITYNGAS